MLMRGTSAEYKKREGELYDKIREVSDEFARLSKAGMDTTEALRRLEAALTEFALLRIQGEDTSKGAVILFPRL
ncbi:hypothetical protein [Sporomusa sp. KB1]|jgi:predicted  nucleic acid-binding Zn-ribbon protein|uniref:hypothetical protein n=1 Tax=Sporomusa sp. KB1 TaxID=943346 RepID=UPI0011A7AB01|nr:hypothetical protein [Sporomusa sp. KB1]TWH47763.1 hypothetical protein Salpa_3849 [Sporomusa sp. KB1]